VALREDTGIYPVMIELASCLCQEMEKEGGPELCSCGVKFGSASTAFCGECQEIGCGGQAWVRLVDAFPSSVFPSADQALSNCKSPWAYQLEVGVIRCAPKGEVSGINGYTPPTLEQNVEALRLQTADLAAMRRAIQCCFGAGDRDYIIGTYAQVDEISSGGCLGGVITVFVREDF